MTQLQLDSRENISLLVRSFYAKVKKDDMIGPIFNNQIDDWEIHLEHLTDFWETNLLFVSKFKGNPGRVHIEVDRANNGSITQLHFGRWLQLWFETINDKFIGEQADLAKKRARVMSTHFFMKMHGSREQQN